MKGVKKSPYPFGLKENMEGGNRAKKLALFILPYDRKKLHVRISFMFCYFKYETWK